jgi:hypothetical protein
MCAERAGTDHHRVGVRAEQAHHEPIHRRAAADVA